MEMNEIDMTSENHDQQPEKVAEQQLPVYVRNGIDVVAKNERFTDYKIEVTAGSKNGDGFVGDILRITIIGIRRTIDEQLKNDKLILIVKIPPLNEQRKAFAMDPFKREVFVYNDILPAFVKFQKDKGIKESEGFFSFPKCYLAQYDEELNDAIIIMEDICEHNFKMENKTKVVGYEHVRILMEKLGQLHAISFAMKHQCPKEFEKYKQLKEIMTEAKIVEMTKPVCVINTDRAIETLESHEENIRQKLIKFRDVYMDELAKCTNGSLAEPYAVLNHGDCWVNNTLFKYEGGQPKEICFLDWQITRYASPVLDLMYFIFACTNKSLRDKYYDTLIQLYYKSLREHVERLGSDPNKVFPYTALLRQLKLFGRFGLVMGLLILPTLCTENEELPDLDSLANEFKDLEKSGNLKDAIKVTAKSDQIYCERVGGVIRDQVKFRFI